VLSHRAVEDIVKDGGYKILLAVTHVTQYGPAMFRALAQQPGVEVEVAYCSLQGARGGMDADFGCEVKWDVPLLDGYTWIEVPNRALRPGLGRFFGLVNTSLWGKIRRGGYDAVVLYTGYRYASFWIALSAAKIRGIPVLFGTDATGLQPLDGSRWKPWVKRLVWPRLFGLADQVLALSTGTLEMIRSLGILDKRITLTPYVVDNQWWSSQAASVDRQAVRAGWGVPAHATVVLFCAKLQPWKRPLDLLRAFAEAHAPNLFLVFAGDGPLREELQRKASELGVVEQVRMLGFINQSCLPSAYSASDVLVLPSEYDAFGLVLNEAMLCGCPAVVSDRVGARYDLIREGETGYVYPCGDVAALAGILRRLAADRQGLLRMGEASRRKLKTWSPKEYAEALVDAVGRAAYHRKQIREG
jgi:glycosyltransferase involved in cell wall biosynthesis